jgi:hypothetical protein
MQLIFRLECLAILVLLLNNQHLGIVLDYSGKQCLSGFGYQPWFCSLLVVKNNHLARL